MKNEHRLIDPHLDLGELCRRVSAEVGVEVAAVALHPTEDQPGTLQFVRMGTTEGFLVDPHTVVAAIDGMKRDQTRRTATLTHTPEPEPEPEPPPPPEVAPQADPDRWLRSAQTAMEEFDAGRNVTAKLLAWRNWLARELDASLKAPRL